MSRLQEKYNNFQLPLCRIFVNGSIPKAVTVPAAEVENTAALTETGSANLKVFWNDASGFDAKKLLGTFPLMAEICIEMGYGEKTETVFEGYVFERELQLDSHKLGGMDVFCLDRKSLLRLNNRFCAYPSVKSYGELVRRAAADYKMDLNIAATPNFPNPITFSQNGVSDFDFIAEAAKSAGYVFYVLKKTLHFKKPGREKSLTIDSSVLLNGSYRNSLAGLYPAIEYLYYNRDVKREGIAKAQKPVKIGKGVSGAEILSKISGKIAKREHFQISSLAEFDIEALARSRLEENSLNLTELYLTVYGLPELAPDRLLTLAGTYPGLDDDYYISTVNHLFNSDGYITKIVCRSNTAVV